MHARRYIVAIIFVLVWYFLEFGQIWILAFFCFLYLFDFTTKKHDRETSTQTDDTPEEAERKVTIIYYILVT